MKPIGPGDSGIESVCIEGYKSLVSEQRLTLRPLTLLAGVNSSGKSSIMQPILLLKQTLEAP
jgi:predicted ATPase